MLAARATCAAQFPAVPVAVPATAAEAAAVEAVPIAAPPRPARVTWYANRKEFGIADGKVRLISRCCKTYWEGVNVKSSYWAVTYAM